MRGAKEGCRPWRARAAAKPRPRGFREEGGERGEPARARRRSPALRGLEIGVVGVAGPLARGGGEASPFHCLRGQEREAGGVASSRFAR